MSLSHLAAGILAEGTEVLVDEEEESLFTRLLLIFFVLIRPKKYSQFGI